MWTHHTQHTFPLSISPSEMSLGAENFSSMVESKLCLLPTVFQF